MAAHISASACRSLWARQPQQETMGNAARLPSRRSLRPAARPLRPLAAAAADDGENGGEPLEVR